MIRPPTDPDGAPPEPHYLSTAQVAAALGVSVTTVKRWVDDAVLPAHRTAGGHRKLLMADVVRAVRAGNLPQADLSRLLPGAAAADGGDPEHLFRQMLDAVRRNEPEAVRGILHGGYRAGVAVETLADRVLAPALAHIGHEWNAGRLGIMHEHRFTQACVSALYELRAVLRANADTDRPVAVGGAPEGDHYALPSLLAKLTLLDCGWDAVNLGPHTPASAFRTAVDELKPTLLWLSATHLTDPESFLAEYRDLYRYAEARNVAVAVGGKALTDAVRGRMPYTSFGDGLTHLASFARTLHRRPAVPKRGRAAL